MELLIGSFPEDVQSILSHYYLPFPPFSAQDPSKYSDESLPHIHKVVAYCARHIAQEEHLKDTKSREELEDSKSTKSLRNWVSSLAEMKSVGISKEGEDGGCMGEDSFRCGMTSENKLAFVADSIFLLFCRVSNRVTIPSRPSPTKAKNPLRKIPKNLLARNRKEDHPSQRKMKMRMRTKKRMRMMMMMMRRSERNESDRSENPLKR